MSILDIFQSGNSLYKRTENGISRINSKLFLYTTEEGKSYISPSDGTIIDDDEYDIYNNKVYKFYPKNLMGFWKKYKKIPQDKIFGIRDNDILYLKNHNLTYESDPSKYRIWYWDIETVYSDHNKPEDPQAPITSISIYDQVENKYFVISWHPEKTKHIPHLKYEINIDTDEEETVKYIKVKDEYNLLRIFVLLLKKYKPMLLVGWFSNFFDTPYVIKRMEINRIDPAYFSPIRRNIYMRPTDENTYKIYIPGIYSIELNKVIERYATTVKFPSMNLGKVAKQLGFNDKLKVNFVSDYENNYDYFLKYNINDVRLTKQINSAFGLIEMLIYVHSASGVSFDNILQSSRIVEDALILYSKDKVIPRTSRKYRGYQGAIVLNPLNHGLVHNVATLDANSMYPTSTITFNVSPETLICSHDDIDRMYNEDNTFHSLYEFICNKANKKLNDIENKSIYKDNPRNYVYDLLKNNNIDYIDTLHTEDPKPGEPTELYEHGYIFFGHKFRPGIYPRYLMKIYGERVSTKQEMKKVPHNSPEWKLLDIQQNGLKLILNVVYGANGFSSFRLYDPRIAETITYFARRLLTYGIDYIKQTNHNIQYGDTDSLFVILHNNTYETCYKEITELADGLNKSIYKKHTMKYSSDELPKHLQSYLGFKLEHILRTVYFSDSKKRYYGIDYSGEHYVKGMNVIRKDSPPLAKKLLIKFISLILEDKLEDTELSNAIEVIKKAPLTEIGIVKSFGKSIDSYNKTIPQHVRGVKFAEELLGTHIDSTNKPYLFYVKPKSPAIGKKYRTFYNVICLKDEDIDAFKSQNEFEIDYIEFIKRQILKPLSEFEYAKGIKDMINKLKYSYKYSEMQQKFNF